MNEHHPQDPNRPRRSAQAPRAGAPVPPGQAQPPRAGTRPRAPGQPPQNQPPPRRRRPTRRQIIRNRIIAAVVVLAVLGLLIGGVMWFFTRDTGPTAPEAFDPGPAAVAWGKNANGVFFNSAGEPILAATKKGIDVSRYQGEVDWAKAQAAGIDFAILRCGFGSEWNGEVSVADYNQDDPQWRRNADTCTELGIPFGVYLYSYATTEERARWEADHVARLLGLVAPPQEGLGDYTAAPYKLSYPVYYDLEDASITGLFPSEAATLAAAFFDQLESHGYTGQEGIYASLNWVRGRLQDPGFDRWRDNFWIARFNTELGYTGPCQIWQSTYTEPGEAYGVQSETVDVDFILEPLTLTGIGETKGSVAPVFSNDTYADMLWLAAPKDRATLLTNEPAEEEGGQRVFWQSSDTDVATVNKNGEVRARGAGTCTVTATLADGRLSAECTVRVGDVTVPVFATGALHGATEGEAISLADVAALKATNGDAILLDAGGSLQGTVPTSLTGGQDMASAFSAAGYDLQAVSGADLAFGVNRLLSDANAAAGPMLAANLRTPEGVALFYRSTSWSRNRITNGMHYIVGRAGHKIGFFALTDADADHARYAVTNETAPLTADMVQSANEQVAALRSEGAEAILCILAYTPTAQDRQALQKSLADLGVTAVIDGTCAQATGSEAVPTVPAATGLDGVGCVEITFAADGKISAETSTITAATLQAARQDANAWNETRAAAYDSAAAALAKITAGDAELLPQTLFTMGDPGKTRVISFGNYVAQLYETLAENDKAYWDDGTGTLYALAGGVKELAVGEVSRSALLEAVPAGARVQLVRTSYSAYAQLVESGAATRTYLGSLVKVDAEANAGATIALITDTATLARLEGQEYTVLRDYGDAFWQVRMAINDATGGFKENFQLPEAPQIGAGRGNS